MPTRVVSVAVVEVGKPEIDERKVRRKVTNKKPLQCKEWFASCQRRGDDDDTSVSQGDPGGGL